MMHRAVVLSSALIFPFSASAALINVTYTDSPAHIFITGRGNDISTSQTYSTGKFVTPDGFWSFTVNIREDNNVLNDELTVSGDVKHLKPPPGPEHAQDGVGTTITFGWGVNADDATGIPLIVTKSIDLSKPHGPHVDDFTGTIIASVHHTALTFLDDITAWSFTIDVSHCVPPTPQLLLSSAGSCPPRPSETPIPLPVTVPEPASFGLLISGIVALSMLSFARRQHSRS
jgi:hypothetical protein